METHPDGRDAVIRLQHPEPAVLPLFLKSFLLSALLFGLLLAFLSSPAAPPVVPPDTRPAGATDREREAFVLKPAAPARQTLTREDVRHALGEAVAWLVRHQFPEGCWDPARFSLNCGGLPCAGRGRAEHEVGVTALAVLALLRGGACDFAAPPGREGAATRAARRGLDWLERAQGGGEAVGDPSAAKFMYGHALATLALCEGHRASGEARYRAAARRAIRLIEAARAPAGGWRYGARGEDADTSVTGWAVAACRAAARIGIAADPECIPSALRWVQDVTDPSDYRVGYTRRGTAGSALPGVNDRFRANEACTAIGILVRRAAGEAPESAAVREGIRRLARDLPRWEAERADFYYWYCGTRALAGSEPPGGAVRDAWSAEVVAALVPNQSAEEADGPRRCARGSWPPADKWGVEGGRACATALNALTLGELLAEGD